MHTIIFPQERFQQKLGFTNKFIIIHYTLLRFILDLFKDLFRRVPLCSVHSQLLFLHWSIIKHLTLRSSSLANASLLIISRNMTFVFAAVFSFTVYSGYRSTWLLSMPCMYRTQLNISFKHSGSWWSRAILKASSNTWDALYIHYRFFKDNNKWATYG